MRQWQWLFSMVSFIEDDKQHVTFHRDNANEKLNITLMSRTGILPEADFYCPIPYEPLHHHRSGIKC